MKMQYLMDTDTFIYTKNHHPPQVLERFKSLKPGAVGISVISYGELVRGAERSEYKAQNHKILEQLFKYIPIQAMPESAGFYYGKIRSSLERQGNIIGGNDLWIAAHALALDLTLVTNNAKEFNRIGNLKIENWV